MADVEVTLTSHLSEVSDALEDAVKTALESVGVQAVSHAQLNITELGAVDTGNLRNSIAFEVEDDTVAIGTNVHYAPYIEYGTGIYAESGGGRQTPWVYMGSDGSFHTTHGAHPRPFLRPAVEENIDEYQQIFETILSQMMNK